MVGPASSFKILPSDTCQCNGHKLPIGIHVIVTVQTIAAERGTYVKIAKFQSKQHHQDEKGSLRQTLSAFTEIAMSRNAQCTGRQLSLPRPGKAYDRIKKDANLKVLLEKYNLMVPWHFVGD